MIDHDTNAARIRRDGPAPLPPDTRTATLTVPLAQGLAFRDLRDALARSRAATTSYRAANVAAAGTVGLGSDARVSESRAVERAWRELVDAKAEVERAVVNLKASLGDED